MIYLINDKEVKRKDFYLKLELCVCKLFPCCIYQIEAENKKLRKIKRQLLDGFIKRINGTKFQIKRIEEVLKECEENQK